MAKARGLRVLAVKLHHPPFNESDYYNASVDVEEVKLMKLNLSE